MAEVFISYSSRDTEKAEAVVAALERSRISCWFAERDIPPGGNYTIEIPKAIEACSYFVLLLSNDAQDSRYVQRELDQAFKRSKEILPIVLENMAQNDSTNFLLNATQAVDATKDFAGALNEVIRCILYGNTDTQRLAYEQKTSKPRKSHDPIRCPYCGNTVLKQQRGMTDRYLDPQPGERKVRIPIIKALDDDGLAAGAVYCVVAMWFGLFLFTQIGSSNPLRIPGFVSSIGMIVVLLMAIKGGTRLYYMMRKMSQAIPTSGLKYQSMKCPNCEKTFGILISKEDMLKDRVDVLVEENTNKE